jgi:hypothetical protein
LTHAPAIAAPTSEPTVDAESHASSGSTGHPVFGSGPIPPVATGGGTAAAGPSASELAYGGAAEHGGLAFAAHVTGKQPSPEGAAIEAKLKAQMHKKYGAAVHDYNAIMMGDDPLEQQMRAALPGITAQLNGVATQRKLPFQFTAAELATNFLAEGGVLLFTDPGARAEVEAGGQIDGYQYLGIDTFGSKRAELEPWMSKDLAAWTADPQHDEAATNEKGEAVHSKMIRDVPQGVEANAVMFADARAQFARAAEAHSIDVSKLPPEAWFFWTTVFYNDGETGAAKLLHTHGIDYWKQPYHGKPNGKSAKYNASWRTGTWDYARTIEGDQLDGKPDAEPAHAPTAG